jgi:hypothetical protein
MSLSSSSAGNSIHTDSTYHTLLDSYAIAAYKGRARLMQYRSLQEPVPHAHYMCTTYVFAGSLHTVHQMIFTNYPLPNMLIDQ